jgi:hypothetical protein
MDYYQHHTLELTQHLELFKTCRSFRAFGLFRTIDHLVYLDYLEHLII